MVFMDISGKRVLITGGALRIGKALCEAFAAEGAEVIIHCNKSLKQAKELAVALPGCNHQIISCDLNDATARANLLQRCGRIDILINNASIFRSKNLFDESENNVRDNMEVNFMAPLSLMKQFAAQPDIQEGCIINFLDQEVAKDIGGGGGYSFSKRALKEATLAGALHSAPRIRINAIAPGPVLAPPGLEHLGMQKTLRSVPLGRAVNLKDLTDACLFLAGNESITGQILYVDCGQHLVNSELS
jgi:NAD(P)-dependent dehydrogenase (short-subunit alcohol dehydrogenase family)